MSSIKLVCPHCGHDGTRETAKLPLESYGFNYLANDVVCREIRGYDEGGRLRLSSDFKGQGSQGTSPRIECRSCWQTFPVPEGMAWVVSPEPSAETPKVAEAVPLQPPTGASSEIRAAAEQMAQNMTALLRGAIEELDRLRSNQVAKVEAGITDLARTVAEVASVQQDLCQKMEDQSRTVSALEQQGQELQQAVQSQQASLNEWGEGLDRRMQAETEEVSQLSTLCSQLREDQQALQKRLDAQAGAIRALHAASEEHAGRTGQLRAAAQKLEEIAGALDQIEPLPDEL